ncbi:MAG: hypothetical protein V1859_09430 [archaeon]
MVINPAIGPIELSHYFYRGRYLDTNPGTPFVTSGIAISSLNILSGHLNGTNGFYIYDPFCGNGVLLACAVMVLKGRIKGVYASDISNEACRTTAANLERICTRAGRERFFGAMSRRRQRTYADLIEYLTDMEDVPFLVGIADASNCDQVRAVLDGNRINLVVTDPPYGNMSDFCSGESGTSDEVMGIGASMQVVHGHMAKKSHVLMFTGTRIPRRCTPDGYHRVDYQEIGRRNLHILQRQ